MKTPKQKTKEKLIIKAKKRKIRSFNYRLSGGPLRKIGLTIHKAQDKIVKQLKEFEKTLNLK